MDKFKIGVFWFDGHDNRFPLQLVNLTEPDGSGARSVAPHCRFHTQIPNLSQVAVSLVRVRDAAALVVRKSPFELVMRVEGAILFPNEIGNESAVGDLAHAISPVRKLKALCCLPVDARSASGSLVAAAPSLSCVDPVLQVGVGVLVLSMLMVDEPFPKGFIGHMRIHQGLHFRRFRLHSSHVTIL
jgi:hypothetical protein